MSGSGVLTIMVPIRVALRMTRLVHLQRPKIVVVFAAVRGTTTIRATSGALSVSGAAQMSGSTSSAFVSPQDRVRIRSSEAAFVFHRSSEAKW